MTQVFDPQEEKESSRDILLNYILGNGHHETAVEVTALSASAESVETECHANMYSADQSTVP